MAEGTPAGASLNIHVDRKWRVTFGYPDGWRRYNWQDGREGVLYAPHQADTATSFSVEIKDLGTWIIADDLDDLHVGFLRGLRSLPECSLESERSWTDGGLVGMEARYTFREAGCLRKRWVRLLFRGRRQFHFVAQGASPGEYEYWLPMFEKVMASIYID